MKQFSSRFLLLCFGLLVLLTVSCSPTPGAPSTPTPTEQASPTRPPAATATATLTTTPVPPPTETTIPPTPAALGLASSAFGSGELIPQRYGRRGENISPPLRWSDPPTGTESFALLVYSDPVPDGGGNWVQWVLYNIPADKRSLNEGLTPDAEGLLPDGSRHFENSWGELIYGGPAPPQAGPFKYYFEIYALDTSLDLPAVAEVLESRGELPWIGPSKVVFFSALEGHILAEGKLVARFQEE